MRSIVIIACVVASFLVSVAQADDKPIARRQPWNTSKLRGTPEPPEPYRIVPAFPQLRFQRPTSLEELPGTDRMVVTEIGGKIFSFAKQAEVSQADLVINLRDGVPAELKNGRLSLLDVEFHPRFVANRQFFVSYVYPSGGGHVRVSRFTMNDATPPRAVADSEQVLITWPSGGHTGGCLEFGPDGYLYISTGDGAGPNPPDGLTTGQDVSDLLGSMLRIDVDHASKDKPYAVPADNPFVSTAGARPEVWAYGLRNPWKFGIDRQGGNVFAADNGWETWEMVHRIVRGGNCGWPVMEGRASLRSEVKLGPTPIVAPVKDHPHTEANSVIGGPVYRGSKLPALSGAFVYGDYITGTIWAIAPDQDQSYSCTTLVDTDLRIVAFNEGSQGELYVLDHDFTGQIYELLPSDAEDLSASFPRRLSQTGLFESLDKLEPAPGVVPYQVTVERWMDGAQAERWVAIPGQGQIELATAPEGASVFPEGTVLVKHLTFVKSLHVPKAGSPQTFPVETQLLHFERGVWRPYSYLWNDDGKDATLVESIGTTKPIKAFQPDSVAPVDRTWHVNAVNECKLCHNAGPKFVLGFTANQLNRHVVAGVSSAQQLDLAMKQLDLLAAQGVLADAPTIAANAPAKLVDPHDETQDLDDRARSYLHGNCAMCHHPGGNAIVSFFLRRDLPFGKLNTNKGTGIGTFGLHDARLVVPGDPYRSVLLYRMSKLGYARMPYIGSRVVDSRGVTLIDDWIRSLQAEQPGEGAVASSDRSLDAKKLLRGARDDKAGTAGELTKSTGPALAVATEIHRGSITGGDRQAAIAAGIAAPSDIRGLFETFIPESQRKLTLGANIDPQTILSRTGDAERGKLIFFSDGARCRNCHELNDRSKSLGPTLQEIRTKYPRTADMLPHVLQPSLKIDEPFAAYTLVTNDGRVVSGLVMERTEQEIVVKNIERQLIRISRAHVDEMQKSDKSLMPERILSDLTAQEAADLFEYLRAAAPQ